jgi:hypothetical protein
MNNALGARYDANTLISEMSVETCASVDMEPWLQPSDSVSLANVASLTPPYSDKEDLNCLIHAPQAYTAWKLTPLITVTGQHNCQGDGTWVNCPNSKTEDTDTINYLTTYSNDFGARFGYEANGLRPYEVNDGETQYTSHIPGANGGPPASVALFGTNNSPVSFQPLDPNIGYSDLINTVQQGLIYCMTELELNSGAQLGGSGSTPKLTQGDLANLQSILNAGPPGNVNWNGQACKNK